MFLCLFPLAAQQAPQPFDGFFVDSAFHTIFAPAQMATLFNHAPGFRASAGYSIQNWSVALGTGLNVFSGKGFAVQGTSLDPIIKQIITIPLTVDVSYDFVFFNRLLLTPKLSAGILFTKSTHYKGVVDLLQHNESVSGGWGFVGGMQVQIGFAALPKTIIVYAAGGADLLPEASAGIIPLPYIQAGIRVYPRRLASFIRNRTAQKKPKEPEPPQEPLPEELLPIFSIRR